MNHEKVVEVEYHDLERNGIVHSVGCLREGSYHLLLIHGEIKGIDIYTYTIVPMDLITRTRQLKVK